MVPAERLAEVFVEVADTLVRDFDLVEFLDTLSVGAAEVSGADAVGLVMADGAGLRFLAASDQGEQFQHLMELATHEGPCVECHDGRRPVAVTDLGATGDRWPRLAPAAVAAGCTSVHTLPMLLRGEAVGVLAMCSREPGPFSPDVVRLVQSLADVATIALLQERATARAETLVEQLQVALSSRVRIEQAKGAMAYREQITPAAAFDRMRAEARAGRRRLGDVAADVLRGLE